MPNQEVIKQTLDLLESMEEGLVYIKKKLEELNTKEAISMLADIINAFSIIEESITPFVEELPKNKICDKINKLRAAFDIMVTEYESNYGKKALEVSKLVLEPAFKSWKEEIEAAIMQYVVS